MPITATITSEEPRTTNRLRNLFASEYLVLVLCVVYFVALAPFAQGFATRENFSNILLVLLPLFILAIGQTLVLISGGIDLSVTSTIALTSVIGGMVMSGEHGWLAGHALAMPIAIVAMLVVGALVGALNGLAVTSLRMPPFIVTLTTMMFVGGFAVWLTKSNNIGALPSAFIAIGNQLWLALSITIAIAVFAHLMLSRSLFGRWLYAVGHNSPAAYISGVPVGSVTCSTYIVSGVCAALASVLLTGQAETSSPVLGKNLLLDVIGATVIGGTSLFGGKGKIIWTFFGVLFLKLIDNSLNLLNLSDWDIRMVKGAVILFAALMDAVRNRFVVRAP